MTPMNTYNVALIIREEHRLGVNHMIWNLFGGGGSGGEDESDDDGTIEAFNDEVDARNPDTTDQNWDTEEIPPDEEAKLDQDIRNGGWWPFG